jgi:hypothetical protein
MSAIYEASAWSAPSGLAERNKIRRKADLGGCPGCPLTSKIRNHTLQALCVQADDLPDEEQRALILVMDGLIKKTQMSKVIGKIAWVNQYFFS